MILKTYIQFFGIIIFTLSRTQNLYSNDQLEDYRNLLEKYPCLRISGQYIKGEIEIITDKQTVIQLQQKEYDRLIKNLPQELAFKRSRAGIVADDSYLIWVRDPVIFPDGQMGLFKRIIWRCTLNNEKPVAVLPITKDKKIVLIKIWRHATGSWEFEIPRGAPHKNEAPDKTALRELQEETGFETQNLIPIGMINPDSGILAVNLAVFIAMGDINEDTNYDENEAISGICIFDIKDLERCMIQGFVEQKEEDGSSIKIPLRDPFLFYALYHAKEKRLI